MLKAAKLSSSVTLNQIGGSMPFGLVRISSNAFSQACSATDIEKTMIVICARP